VAPPERDLWMLIPEHGHGDLLRQYRDATGHTAQRDRLRLYSLGWDLAEIGEYVAQFRAPHNDTEDVRDAWRNLRESIGADPG
jgi:hypothetical protein